MDFFRLDLEKIIVLKNKKPKDYEKLLIDLQIVLSDLKRIESAVKINQPVPPANNLCAGCKKKIDWNKNTKAFRTKNLETNQIENWCSQECNDKTGKKGI